MPYVKATKKISDDTLIFKGYDNSSMARESNFKDTKNLSADSYPYTTTRPKREVIQTISDPNALFGSKKLCWVSGTGFYYDGVLKGSVIDGPKSMVDINGNIVIFPDKKYYDYILGTFGSFTAPDIDYAVEWNNRVWGVKGQDIKASKLGDFKTWDYFEALASDSWATNVDGSQPLTGIVAYQNHITLSQGYDKFYEIYGSLPSNFTVNEVSVVGALNHKSIIEVNSILFFLNPIGVQAYSGGVPRPVSTNIDQKYVSAVCGKDKLKLYSCIFDGISYSLFVYDTLNGLWYKEDDLNILEFTNFEGYLYGLSVDGRLIKFDSGLEKINWSLETQQIDFRVTQKKYVSKISIRAELETGTTMDIYIKYDKRPYMLAASVKQSNTTSLYEVPIPLSMCDSFQLKIEGKGDVIIKELHKSIMLGGK